MIRAVGTPISYLEYWGCDKDYYYREGRRIDGADYATFTPFFANGDGKYAKDRAHIFYCDSPQPFIVEGADLETFEILNNNRDVGKDKNNYYHKGKEVSNDYLLENRLIESVSNSTNTKTVHRSSTDTSDDNIRSLDNVDEEPLFNGKPFIDVFSEYIKKNLDYPFRRAAISLVEVEFIVEKDGSVSNAKILRGRNQNIMFADDVLRVVASSSKWTPAKVDGEAVRVKIHYSVRLRK